MLFNIELENNNTQKLKLRKNDNKYFVSFNDEEKETEVDFCECGEFYSVIINNKPYVVNLSQDSDWQLANNLLKLKLTNDENSIRKKLKESYSSNSSRVISKIPGKILEVRVKEGDMVSKGDILFILEAMKMENRIYANKDAKIKKILVSSGDLVMTGHELLIFE